MQTYMYVSQEGFVKTFRGLIHQDYKAIYVLPICSMVLEYLPTFAQTKSPSHVGEYTSTMGCIWVIHRHRPHRFKMEPKFCGGCKMILHIVCGKCQGSVWQGCEHKALDTYSTSMMNFAHKQHITNAGLSSRMATWAGANDTTNLSNFVWSKPSAK